MEVRDVVPIFNTILKKQDILLELKEEKDIYMIPESMFIKIAVVFKLREKVMSEMFREGYVINRCKIHTKTFRN